MPPNQDPSAPDRNTPFDPSTIPVGAQNHPLFRDAISPSSKTVDDSQMPTAPAVFPESFQTPGQSMPQYQTQQPTGKKKKYVFLAIASLLLLVGGISTASYVYLTKTDPDKLYNNLISNSLKVTSYHQITTEKDTDGSLYSKSDIKVDLSDIKNPKSSTVHTFDEKSTELPSKLETYGAKNTYLKVSTKDAASFGIVPEYVDKWVKIESQASVEDGSLSQYFEALADAKTNLFGHFAIGNYSDADRQELSSFIINNKVYAYDKTQVTKEDLNGTSVLVYKVEINQEKLSELNEKIANILGVDKESLALFEIQGFSEIKKAKLYVDSKRAVLLKVTADTDVGTTENVYSEYGTTVIPEEPKSEANFEQAFNLDDLLNIEEGTQGNDIERKTDINVLASHLEAFNAQNGYYPTLENLNDPAFRADNMQGLEVDALKDPDGNASVVSASPSVHVYAYTVNPAECDNGENGDCTMYTLTATLDSGGTYVKQSLN